MAEVESAHEFENEKGARASAPSISDVLYSRLESDMGAVHYLITVRERLICLLSFILLI